METKTKLGLIGKGISYSFSQKFFEDKFKKLMLHDFSYQLLDLESEVALQNFLQDCPFLGLNVTIPYKEKIIPFLDELSVEAQEIGAVNTVLFNNNKKIGYNTDVIGFEKTLQLFQKSHHQSAIVLGNGGAAKAVAFVLKKNKIPFTIVSRTEGISFENLSPRVVSENTIIVQCTPVGTFPNGRSRRPSTPPMPASTPIGAESRTWRPCVGSTTTKSVPRRTRAFLTA